MECCSNRNPGARYHQGYCWWLIGNKGFQFLPKSVTLDDNEGLLSTLASKILVFSEFTTNFWMNFFTTLSLTKMQAFWQYKFYTDIQEGCVPTIVSLGQRMMLANSKPKTPATARLSYCWMLALWQAHEQTFTWLTKSPVFRIQQSGSPTYSAALPQTS